MKNFVNIFLFMVCLSLGLVVINQKGKIYVIEDLMGPNERNKIDIFMHSEKDALNWSVQKLEITLLEEKDTTKSTFVAFNK